MKKKEQWNSSLTKTVTEIPTGLCLCIISLLAVLCFHPSVEGGFVFDDTEAVVNNDDVKLTTPLTDIFKNDFWGTPVTHNASHKSYRPLTIISFRLNVLAAGGRLIASDFHFTNLVLYVMVCCLSLLVLRALCGGVNNNWVAFIASVLFTTHPVHTEAISPVVGRADLLCALFTFCAFLVYNWPLKRRKESLVVNALSTILTIIFAAISMFTKEQGITILAVCCVYDLLISQKFHPNQLLKMTWKPLKLNTFLVRQITLLLATVSLLLVRWWLMGGTAPLFQRVDNPASFMDSMLLRAINYIYIYALNVWLLLCPEWLCFDWSMGCVPLIDSALDTRILVVILFSIFCSLLVFSTLKSTSEETRCTLVALTFMVLPFLPASNIFFRVGFVIAERTLLIPSLGFCMLIALGLRRLAAMRIWQQMIPPFLATLVLVYSVRSHLRTTQWISERQLFLSALSVCPLNAKVHYNLAKTSQNNTLAMKHYKDALRLNPAYDQAMNNLANILKDLGELSEAEKLLRRALTLRPDFAAAWMNLGIVLSNKKKFPEAEQCYLNAIKYRKKYPDCLYNLGNLYLEQKEHAKAYKCWREATSMDPGHHAAWNNLIIMLDSIGKHSKASSLGKEALAVLPNSSAIHFNIANALGKTSNYGQAEKHFKAAIKLNPNYALYYINLGVLYHHWKKFALAKEMYRQALKLDPNLKSAKENLRLLQNT